MIKSQFKVHKIRCCSKCAITEWMVCTEISCSNATSEPIPVAARSKAWVYSRSLTGIVGSNPARGMDVCLL